ncbi:MAG: HlyD family efflux transporter periplasmic adaptor subunit [Planctomycetes bacterium]|nr:HlyD family efflux transporter periplasmic adaptor subunit [Planctomycetota bacterium]
MEANKKSTPRGLAYAGALVVGGAILGALAVYMFLPRAADDCAPEKSAKDRTLVSALGRIEPKGGVLNLGVPFPDVVKTILVAEGADVKKNAELALLESHDIRKLESSMAREQLADAQKKRASINQKADAQLALDKLRIAQARESFDEQLQATQVAYLKQKLEFVQEDLARLRNSSVSQQELDHQRLGVATAQTELASAQQKLAKIKATQKLNLETAQAQEAATKTDRDSSLRDISIPLLESKVTLAQAKVREATLVAPSDGRILKVLARRGELVGGQQPIMQMADVSKMIVVAEVYETDAGLVKPGQAATIESRALTGKLSGSVYEKANMVGQGRVRDIDPMAQVHQRIVEVRILLDPSSTGAAAKLIHHQVTVKIAVE